MKHISFVFAIFLVFSSCGKEEISDSNAPFFVCTIGGDSFSNDIPIISVNSFDMMSIDLSDGTYDLSFRIYYFSTININETVYFSTPGMGMVTYNGVTYSNFYNPPYDGELVFTEIGTDKLSGIFHFKAQDVAAGSFLNINVIDGEFENIIY